MRFFCFLLLLCSFSVNAQQPCSDFTPGGSAQSSISLCAASGFSQTNLPDCTGPFLPIGGCPDPVTSNKSIWYKIHCYSAGTFGFLITPKNAGDDFDFQVMNITNKQASDVYTMNLTVSLNQVSSGGSTGCIGTGTKDYNCASSSSSPYNKLLNVLAGSRFMR